MYVECGRLLEDERPNCRYEGLQINKTKWTGR